MSKFEKRLCIFALVFVAIYLGAAAITIHSRISNHAIHWGPSGIQAAWGESAGKPKKDVHNRAGSVVIIRRLPPKIAEVTERPGM